jgi:hypothetical protein
MRAEAEKGRAGDRLAASGRRAVVPPSVQVQQQPLGALPPSQSALGRFSKGAVETRVERTPEGLQITLYLDPLFPPESLERAVVEWVRADSLVVHIDGQAIGYRLPEGYRVRE